MKGRRGWQRPVGWGGLRGGRGLEVLGHAKPTLSWRVGQVGDVTVFVAGDLEPPFEFPVPVSHWHVLFCFPATPSSLAVSHYRSALPRRSVPMVAHIRTIANWQAWQARCP